MFQKVIKGSENKKWLVLGLFALILLNILVLNFVFSDQLEVPQETETSIEYLEDDTEEITTAEAITEGTVAEEETETENYPENAVFFEDDMAKMTYFRAAMLNFFDIPSQLHEENAWLIEGYMPKWDDERKINLSPNVYYNQTYVAAGLEINWDGRWDIEHNLRYIYNVGAIYARDFLKAYAELTQNDQTWLKVSASLTEGSEKTEKYYSWGRCLEAAAHWHTKQTGELWGTVRGEILITEVVQGVGGYLDFWICIEGLEPIKVRSDSSKIQTGAPEPIEGAVLNEEERVRTLYQLTFELKTEPCAGAMDILEISPDDEVK